MKHLRSAALVLVLAVAALISTTGTASASTPSTRWGGVGDPSGCSAYTVRSAAIKDWKGSQVGTLEVRWSPTCVVQWARVTSYNGAYHMAVSIHEKNYPNNAAGGDSYGLNQWWSNAIVLRGGSSAQVCAYADLDPGVPFGTGTSFCV